METAIEPVMARSGNDPMAQRWAINFVRDKFIDSDKAGISILPFGRFFAVKRFQIPEAIHTVDDNPNLPAEELKTKTAQMVELYLGEMLAGRTLGGDIDPHKDDWGARFGFYGEEDIAKMEVISTTLLPALTTFQHKCIAQDSFDFTDRETCAVCWLDYVNSPECADVILEMSQTGCDVEITNTVTRTKEIRLVRPTVAEFETGRELVRDSLRHFIASAQKTWGQVAKELEEGTRRGIDAYQNNLRKDVHADKPTDANLRQVREYAKAVGSGGGQNGEVMERVVGVLDRIDQRLTRLEAPVVEAQASNPQYLIDGQPIEVVEVKQGGWVAVKMADGTSQTVRKDKLQEVENANVS